MRLHGIGTSSAMRLHGIGWSLLRKHNLAGFDSQFLGLALSSAALGAVWHRCENSF
jgi:hypothetical protein